jgi:hypothetical protein
LWAAAIEDEQCDDFGPAAASVRRGLEVFCESIERDARPHGIGRYYLYFRVCGVALHTCLRVAPSVRAGLGPTRPPLVVCGLPRSGTTLLHRLLEQADGARGIPLWQLTDPRPSRSGRDQRRHRSELNISRMRRMVPLPMDAQHFVRPDLSDECGHLLRNSFLGSMPWQIPAFGWLEWALAQDTAPAYRQWAALLHHLEPPGIRLVLKDPFHAANLEELLAVCPEATIVQTHRDPLEVMPSFHKLCTTVHSVTTRRLDLPRTVEAHMRWLVSVVERNEQGRSVLVATGRRDRVLDVQYAELLADPIRVVERIHEHARLPLTGAEIDRMRTWLLHNQQRRHGSNPYSVEAFGQRPEEVAERFAGYREAWGYRSTPV